LDRQKTAVLDAAITVRRSSAMTRPSPRIALALLIAACAVAVVAVLPGCGADDPAPESATGAGGGPAKVERVGAAGARSAVMIAAGDIAQCDNSCDTATGELVGRTPGVVQLLGDNAYPSGTPSDYARCYQPTWGSFKGRTLPATGNHEYRRSLKAEGYFRYFGRAARPPEGYYSYDIARWHVVVLNSTCYLVGGCGPASAQAKWLRADLDRSKARCTLAVWHHPRFSSGTRHGSNTLMSEMWRILQANGGDVVLSGHEHNYERFAPQREDGTLDTARGLREFVAGTGGARHYPFSKKPLRNSQSRGESVNGVLRLELLPEGYSWRFLRASGRQFSDSGSGRCH
jgi:acid phosphatase type 7